MKILIIICLLFTSCVSEKNIVKEGKALSEKNEISQPGISTGWSDQNTYTVKVLSKDIDTSVEAARHQILQDIVRVRMLNESRFTDISGISREFEKPLRNGRIISQKSVPGGIEVYYQIRDEGLKKKFETR